jgi:quercetin dioxygenase-like cupin family protein
MHTMKVAVVFLVISGATAVAQQMPMPMNAGDLKWGPAPNVLPRGAQIVVVSGDPSKDALYVVRLKLPANYELPAHNHPTSEYVTVITGDFHIGMGTNWIGRMVWRYRPAVLPKHQLR